MRRAACGPLNAGVRPHKRIAALSGTVLATSLQSVRRLALSLADTTEEPHHHLGSFRVRGKIFVTVPPGEQLLHIFLPDAERELALAMDPEFLEPLTWGGKVVGVRAMLPLARTSTIRQLVRQAYLYKSAATPRKARSSPGTPGKRGKGGKSPA